MVFSFSIYFFLQLVGPFNYLSPKKDIDIDVLHFFIAYSILKGAKNPPKSWYIKKYFPLWDKSIVSFVLPPVL